MKQIKRYNKNIIITGEIVTIKDYTNDDVVSGYTRKINVKKKRKKIVDWRITKYRCVDLDIALKIPYILNKNYKVSSSIDIETFNKITLRAQQNIFDIINANINEWRTYNVETGEYDGEKAYTKFLTLTFKENITDMKKANREFTKFNMRLSYKLYKVRKNVLKYLCVPEFQKRGAIHYHVIYFNLPFVNWEALMEVWNVNNTGGVYIECIKDKDKNGNSIESVAKYIAKYVSKNNSVGEDNYTIWRERGLLNQKRYFTSRGLLKKKEVKIKVDTPIMADVYQGIAKHCYYLKEYETEYRGNIVITKYKMDKRYSQEMINWLIMNDTSYFGIKENMDINEYYKQANKKALAIMRYRELLEAEFIKPTKIEKEIQE